MKEYVNFNNFNKFYLSIFLLFFAFFLLCSNVYSYAKDRTGETAVLQITIDDKNNISGMLLITQLVQPKDIETSFILLPFALLDQPSTNDNAVITSENKGEYTVLQLITSKNSPNLIRIDFRITTSVVDSSQINRDQDATPDFFLIEQRGVALYTLHFRYDILLSDMPFGNLASLTKAMIIPSKVIIDFPKDAVFTTIPPNDLEPYNVSDGSNPGTYKADEFTTPIEFYQGQALRVNYSFPQPLPPLPSVLIIIILSLSLFIPTVLTFPDEFLRQKLRVRYSAMIAIAIPLMLIALIIWNGVDFLISYFIDKYDLLIPGIFIYIFCSAILIFRVPFSKMKGLLHLRIVLQVPSTVLPRQSTPGQTPASQNPSIGQGTIAQNHPEPGVDQH